MLCNEIFEYQNGNGILNHDTKFYNFFKENQSKYKWDIRFFENLILDEASIKLDKVIKLLMLNRPYVFIKK